MMWLREVRCFTNLRTLALIGRLHYVPKHCDQLFHTTKVDIARYSTSRSRSTISASANNPEIHPKTPLCERVPTHSADLAGLISWYRDALVRIAAIGDAWLVQDEGPSQEDLETELSWLLDDAVAALIDGETGAPERPVTWRSLERDLKTGTLLLPDNCTIKLRESLDQIDYIWKQRLEARAPLQYLTCAAFWRDVVLSVGPGVLIPRPETELIIDFVASAAAARPDISQGQWADLGTGSGALAIGVARQLPAVPRVWAVDAAAEPAAHAAFNAQRLGVGERVKVVQGSWYEPLKKEGVERLAGIVSNPPYIASEDMPNLQTEVGRHEPRLALDGGQGLAVDCLTPICQGAAKLLQPGGFIALETSGKEQAEFVSGILQGMGFIEVEVKSDLRGVDRFVTGTKA